MQKTKHEKSQSRRFIETARKFGCDENESAFEKKLGKIAKVKPSNKKQKAPR